MLLRSCGDTEQVVFSAGDKNSIPHYLVVKCRYSIGRMESRLVK
jgi:hypothetical protein